MEKKVSVEKTVSAFVSLISDKQEKSLLQSESWVSMNNQLNDLYRELNATMAVLAMEPTDKELIDEVKASWDRIEKKEAALLHLEGMLIVPTAAQETIKEETKEQRFLRLKKEALFNARYPYRVTITWPAVLVRSEDITALARNLMAWAKDKAKQSLLEGAKEVELSLREALDLANNNTTNLSKAMAAITKEGLAYAEDQRAQGKIVTFPRIRVKNDKRLGRSYVLLTPDTLPVL